MLAMFFALCVCVGVSVMVFFKEQGIVLGLIIVVFGLFSTYKYEQSSHQTRPCLSLRAAHHAARRPPACCSPRCSPPSCVLFTTLISLRAAAQHVTHSPHPLIAFALLLLIFLLRVRSVLDNMRAVEKRSIKWGIVSRFAFATIDFATDILFLRRLSQSVVGTLSYALYVTGMVSLTISIIGCLVAVAVALKALKADPYTAKNQTFATWQSNNAYLIALVSLISATRNDALAFLFSETKVPFLGCFDAPVSPEQRRRLEELGLVAVAIEDFPQVRLLLLTLLSVCIKLTV